MKTNIAVIGLQLGDEAKGRCAHYFSVYADWVVRTNGSNNAGHQIFRNGKSYIHHLLPSTDFRYKNIKSFLASGMMINLEDLLQEVKDAEKDFPGVGKSIYVDPDAFVILPKHIQEDKEKNAHIGSTNKGVGPATVDKYGRTGTRVYNFINDNADVVKALKGLGVQFTPLLKLREEFERSSIVFEGAQGVLLDLQASPTYPYCTTSDCTVSGIYSSGFNFVKLDKVYGIMKPYLTKAGGGNGPFFTKMSEDEASKLRTKGDEIGKTTGRNRLIGHLDLPAASYAIQRGGISSIILTKMDILNGQRTVKVCTSYGKEVYGVCDFQSDITPSYIDLPGWDNARNLEQVQPFLGFLQGYLGTQISYISVGVDDKDMIEVKS